MASQDRLYHEEEHKRRGIIISLVIHLLLLLFFLLPFLTTPILQQSEGILIAFGDPDAGSDDAQEVVETNSESATSTAALPTKSQNETITSTDPEEEAPIKVVDKKTTKTAEADKSKSKELSESKIKAEAKAKADAAAKAESERVAAEKAKAEKDAAEKAKAAADQKKKYSDLLGKGKGNNNSTGNQGTATGDPDGKALEGISKGSGIVGGGLKGRGIEYSPSFTDSSQKTGKVSLSICVNIDGKVTKAEFTQKGSTTSDSYLIELARKTAMKYKFNKSEIDSQCGTVIIDFRVQ
jgi:outer membrane biosynthesis protein TonB